MDFNRIFDEYNTIAVIGMSKNAMKPAHQVPAYFIGQGYDIYPINPTTDSIAGLKAYPSLKDVPAKIDILNVFRPSAEAEAIVSQAVERRKETGDIRLIWLQEGIINESARQLAEDNGIEFIQDKCMYKEYIHK
ncbi:MAG: CoA-binding protein [Candidatus Kapaibacterium sp.]